MFAWQCGMVEYTGKRAPAGTDRRRIGQFGRLGWTGDGAASFADARAPPNSPLPPTEQNPKPQQQSTTFLPRIRAQWWYIGHFPI